MKQVSLFILFLGFYTYSFSQANLGLRSGINVSDYTEVNNSEKRISYYIGAIVPINFGTKYILQPELNYSKEGNSITLFDNSKYKLHSDYLSISVVNKYRITSKFNLLFGPYFAIRTSKEVSRSYTSGGWALSFKHTINLFEKNDSGFIIGFEYNINKSLALETRFKKGHLDALNLDYFSEDYDNKKEKTQVFQVGITYKFDLKQTKN